MKNLMSEKAKSIRKKIPFSSNQLTIFVLLFAAVGGYLLIRSFAATTSMTGASTAICSPSPCTPGPVPNGSNVNHVVITDVNNGVTETRNYGYYIPNNLLHDGSAQGKPAAVFELARYGTGGNGENTDFLASQIGPVADANRFIVVILTEPAGASAWIHPETDCGPGGCDLSSLPSDNAYIQAAVNDATKKLNIDPARRYLTGGSSAANMARDAVCSTSTSPHNSTLFRGFMTMGGGANAPLNSKTGVCPSGAKTAFWLEIMGKTSAADPYTTITLPATSPNHTVMGFDDTRAWWSSYLGACQAPVHTTPGSGVLSDVYAYNGCNNSINASSPMFEAAAVTNGGHMWCQLDTTPASICSTFTPSRTSNNTGGWSTANFTWNYFANTTTSANTTTPAPTVSLTASPSSITPGQSSTLTWGSANATSCNESGSWSGAQATSGSKSVTPTANSTYTLTCTGAGGSANSSSTILVTATPPPSNGGGNAIWNGDLQTGNFSQWSGLQDTAQSGTASVGSHTSYTMIKPAGAPLLWVGDAHVYSDSTGNSLNKSRAELLTSTANSASSAGSTATYDWYSYYPSTGNSCQPAFQVFTQFATNSAYNTPHFETTTINGIRHLQMAVYQGTLSTPNNAEHDDLGALQFNHWYHYQLYVKWGRSANTGAVQLTVDGTVLVPLHNHQTMPSDSGQGYLKQGVYQHDGCDGEQYLAGTKVYTGTSTSPPPSDTTVPSVSLTAPASGSIATGTKTLSAAASDNVGVAGVQFKVDGTNLGGEQTVAPYTTTWNSALVVNGVHTLSATARDAAGNTNTSSVIVTASNGDTMPPSTPTGITAKASAYNSVSVSWAASTDNVGVSGYYLVRNGVTIAQISGTSYSDSALSPQTAYSYQVIAYDAAGNNSGLSAKASTTTPSVPDTQAPSVPTGITASAVSTSQINLSWTASNDNIGVTGYDVYRNNIKIATVATTSLGDTGLAASTTYSYYAIARDASGNVSTASAIAKALTQALTPTSKAVNGPLSGIVKNDATSEPITNATVSISYNGTKHSASTTSTGSYLLKDIPADSYKVTFTATHYITKTVGVTIVAGTNNQLNAFLVRR